jgi:tRNA G37 N-methylase TrmD
MIINTINWRDEFGIGNYKQVDDKPYGGGSSMVLQAEPIYQALNQKGAVSPLYKAPTETKPYDKVFPNNFDFYEYCMANPAHKTVTISLTPRWSSVQSTDS